MEEEEQEKKEEEEGALVLINQPLPLSLSSLFDELFLIYDRLFNPHYVRWDGGARVMVCVAPPPHSALSSNRN